MLSQELLKLEQEVHISARFHINKHIEELPEHCIHGKQIERFRTRLRGPLMAANRWADSNNIKKYSADILHETYYTSKSVNKRNAKRILTVYDMIHERFNHEPTAKDPISSNKKAACEAADHIICISQSTKRDLCEFFSINESKITVTHLGFDQFKLTQAKLSPLEKPFILFVGKRSGYKNFDATIKAVGSNKVLADTINIVAFGGGDFTRDELQLASHAGLQPGSLKYFNGDDETLGQLYGSALALVYPSLYEGFGLPPLEAMAHQCPVIASNTSSMPEVIGPAGALFDPYDIDAQSSAIERVISDGQYRQELIARGDQQLKNFSWGKCARETLDVYQRT